MSDAVPTSWNQLSQTMAVVLNCLNYSLSFSFCMVLQKKAFFSSRRSTVQFYAAGLNKQGAEHAPAFGDNPDFTEQGVQRPFGKTETP